MRSSGALSLWVQEASYEIVITEIGGTVGDIESLPYIEAVRQMRWELGPQNCIVIHLTLVPFLHASGELKTKPTQHSVKMLLEEGIQPDVLVLRTEHPLTEDLRRKVALFCNVEPGAVVESIDVSTIYEVPFACRRRCLTRRCCASWACLPGEEPSLAEWKEFLHKLKNPAHRVKVALVGKYVELADAYKSITEAFIHAGAANEAAVELTMIHSEEITENNYREKLDGYDGLWLHRGLVHGVLRGRYLRLTMHARMTYLSWASAWGCSVL
jgi:CTP synthase